MKKKQYIISNENWIGKVIVIKIEKHLVSQDLPNKL